MSRTECGMRLVGLIAAMVLLATPAIAGDFQLGLRVGRNGIDVDGDRLSSGISVNDHMISWGVAASYRRTRGGFVEVGTSGYRTFDLFGIRNLDHHWIGVGWTYDLYDHWKLTPQGGLAYSKLTWSDENPFTSEPVEEFADVVPFVELTLHRRFWRHVSLGLYFRHTFEDWGRTRDLGLTMSWTFD